MEFRTTIYCDKPDCRCLDRAGVIVYRGAVEAAANDAADIQCPTGYRSEVTEVDTLHHAIY